MRKAARILAYGLTAGVVLPVVVLFLFDLYLKKSNADMFRHLVHSERKLLVEKVDEYISENGRLPFALSELGYEQTPTRYVGRRGNEFYLICDGDDYFIESWDNHGVRWQYSSKERKWHDKAVYEFEPPVNIDTLREINRIARLDKMTLELAPGEWIENADILPILAIDENDPDSYEGVLLFLTPICLWVMACDVIDVLDVYIFFAIVAMLGIISILPTFALAFFGYRMFQKRGGKSV